VAVNCLCKIHISAKAITESQKDTVIFEILSFLYVDAIHNFYTKGAILWKSLEFQMSNNSSAGVSLSIGGERFRTTSAKEFQSFWLHTPKTQLDLHQAFS